MIADILHKIKEFEREDSHPYIPRPSLAGPQRCIRYLDYYRQGYERKPFPGRFMVVLEDSSLHEVLIQDIINKSAFELHSSQMKVTCGSVNGVQMVGHIDGVVTDLLNVDRLIEIKALSHFGFQDIWAGALPLDYIYQTSMYARGLHELNPDIHEAIILIKNKNQGQFCEILLDYDFHSDSVLIKEMILSTGEKKEINQGIDNVVQAAGEKFEEVERYAQEKKLHDRQYQKDNWRCQYCVFGELCWTGWEEEFEQRDETAITLGEDEEVLCRYYKETGAQASEMKKEHEERGEQIKKLMQGLNAKMAKAGEYTIKVRMQSKDGIDEALIPPAILERARTHKAFEVLDVRKRKNG